ncbi:hypothetical protein LEP1GSC035_4529 [Leptospira noguchii str. 2007001578]|uniref:Uncharacterized protein n=1 Tax=Leptospira noguchii str. 2007001578 TaxID=1049974 RepID=A0ABP2TD65_9LEPT|nr:hypothetical protein LEP1GSC035_4529 [Leptospira noguchii str. 2007001578]
MLIFLIGLIHHPSEIYGRKKKSKSYNWNPFFRAFGKSRIFLTLIKSSKLHGFL